MNKYQSCDFYLWCAWDEVDAKTIRACFNNSKILKKYIVWKFMELESDDVKDIENMLHV